MSEQPETLCPLVLILRKWKNLTSKQSQTFAAKLVKIFKQQDAMHLLSLILMNGIAKNHSKLSPEILEAIYDVLPDESDITITDTIFQSTIVVNKEDTDNKENKAIANQKLSFLQIPSDIKIHTFHNYLKQSDLYTLEKTCRCLLITARNPQSIRTLEVHVPDKRYLHQRYLSSHPLWIDSKYVNMSSYTRGQLYIQFNRDWESVLDMNVWMNSLQMMYDLIAIKSPHYVHLNFEYFCDGIDDERFRFANSIFQPSDSAERALKSIKQLEFSSDNEYMRYAYCIWIVLRNIFVASDYIKEHRFDLVQLRFEHDENYEMWNGSDWVWHWDVIDKIGIHSKELKIDIDMMVVDHEYMTYDECKWDEWINHLISGGTNITDLSIVILHKEQSDRKSDLVQNWENHMTEWLEMNENVMKQIHMKSFELRMIYEMVAYDDWLYPDAEDANTFEEYDDELKELHAIFKQTQWSVNSFCKRHRNITIDMGYALVIDYKLKM